MNTYRMEIVRNGKVIDIIHGHNMVTTAGKNLKLEVMFRSGSAAANWYLGLINNSPTPTLDIADTMSSHAGWAESADYDEATRPQWSPGAASGGSVVNGSVVTFTISATVSIYGFFCTTVNTKSGTTGTLYGTAAFADGVRTLIDNDVINIYYTVTD